jgi:signal transduction histidine kinase
MTAVKTKTRDKRAAAPTLREQRRLERRCEALHAEVHALERARAELCSVLSHDLRNPLTLIHWNSQILGRHVPEGGANRLLETMKRAAAEMSQILDDLSDASRIPDGRLILRFTRCDLAEIIEAAVAPSRAGAAAKDVAFAVEIEEGLGPLSCDHDRLGRVLAGLVAGALRRTPRGGSMAVRAGLAGGLLRIRIEDSGVDVPEHERASLFELPPAVPPGTARIAARALSPALGLFVARGVMEAHGGHVAFEGEPGKGSRFVLALPLDQDDGAASGPGHDGGHPRPPGGLH